MILQSCKEMVEACTACRSSVKLEEAFDFNSEEEMEEVNWLRACHRHIHSRNGSESMFKNIFNFILVIYSFFVSDIYQPQ